MSALQAMVRKELPSANQVRGVRSLRIAISRGQHQIATIPVVAWSEDGQILVDGEKGHRGLAIALAKLDPHRKLADTIENILRAEDDDEVKQRLRDFGIPEEAIREAIPPRSPESQNEQPSLTQSMHPGTPTVTPPAVSAQTGTSSHSVRHDSVRNETTHQKDGPDSPPLADSSEKGKHAEDWLRDQIRRRFDTICTVTSVPVRDEQNRETDILVTPLAVGSRPIHIEVKRLEGRTVYWSGLEVSKAQDLRGDYFMALLRPIGSAEEYSVHWLWDPLSDLLSQQRRGIWLWEGLRTEVPLDSAT
jgi:hypothetical protein